MFHKVKMVMAMPGYKLKIQFAEGVFKIYDMRPVLDEMPEFHSLNENEKLFQQVQVDAGGYGISWNDELDLSCDELWMKGTAIQTPFAGLIAMSDATQIWNLHESTLRKAISYGKLLPGEDVCKYGNQWVISVEAMCREYGKPK